MSPTRPWLSPPHFPSNVFGLLLAACGHAGGRGAVVPEPTPIAAAEPAGPAESAESAEPVESESALSDTAVADATPVGSSQPGAQKITFDDDADPEPTTQVQSAPKRPPMPRFKLFGTREGDGPN